MPDVPQTYDSFNHPREAPGTVIAAAAAGTSAVGTVIPVAAGAGAGSTTAIESGQNPVDSVGRFQIVTAGAPAAGKVATLFFAQAWDKPPVVQVEAYDVTGAAAVAISPNATATQIDFYTGALTTAHTITVDYSCRKA